MVFNRDTGIANPGQAGCYNIDLVRRSTIWAFLCMVVYKLALDISYCLIISPVWEYARYTLHVNAVKLVESYFLLIVITVCLPRSFNKLSHVMVSLFIILSYVPMLTLYALKDESRIFMYAVTGFWLVMLFFVHMPSVSFPYLREARTVRISIFAFLSILVFVMIYKYLGFSFNLNLAKVYEIRSSFTEMGIPLSGYFFNWVGYIINPVFFAMFSMRRKWLPVAFILFLQILLFSSTGNKTFLFALVFVLGLMWITARKNPLSWMLGGLTALTVLGMLSYWLAGDVWISSLFVRRTLLDQAQQYFFYYDFFSNNDVTLLSQHTIFNLFSQYPYDLPPPNLIGDLYLGNPENSANTGLLGDAYMNFGFIGFVVWGLLLISLLKFIDSLSEGKDMRLTIAAVAMPVMTLINSALLTNLLTHGLLLSLILLYLLPEKD